MKSDQIGELTQALSAAQGEFQPVSKTGRNPHFDSMYVTLDGIIDAVRKPLSDHGLAFSQMLDEVEGGTILETILMHTSGQWISSRVRVSPTAGNRGVNELQSLGSALTYMKRYALSAMLGIAADEDDDGNSGTAKTQTRKAEQQKTEAQSSDNDLWFDCVEFGVFDVKGGGKPHIGFMGINEKWPSVKWWKGREELLNAAPWLGSIATKEQMNVIGSRFGCNMRVYYEETEKGYKNATRFEIVEPAVGAAG